MIGWGYFIRITESTVYQSFDKARADYVKKFISIYSKKCYKSEIPFHFTVRSGFLFLPFADN